MTDVVKIDDVADGRSDATAKLTLGNNQLEFPIYEGTIGPRVIDISKLYGSSGYFTYDPGFTSTASCRSSITYIDGDEGILLYRVEPKIIKLEQNRVDLVYELHVWPSAQPKRAYRV